MHVDAVPQIVDSNQSSNPIMNDGKRKKEDEAPLIGTACTCGAPELFMAVKNLP